MTRRMSNRDRIEHMRAEADATAKEKEAAKAAKAAAPKTARSSTRKAASAPTPRRVRIVWSVCDQSGKDVQQFPYAQEEQARAEAAQRTASSGRTHFVKQADVAVE